MADGEQDGRQVPQIPPPDRKIRLLIDTDAGCEIDDQYAIALAVLSPERFEIEGFVSVQWGSPDTLDRTVREIETVLEKAAVAGRYPVRRGSDPLRYIDLPEESEGVDFIIERAMAPDRDEPLYVVSLGAATNIASACIKEPAIARRIVSVYHTRSQWPVRGANANILMDLKAARRVFSSDLPLIMFDTGTYIRWTMDRSEELIRPHGPLGDYLHEIRSRSPGMSSYEKGIFDLGDVAFLVDPSLAEGDVIDAPTLRKDSTFDTGRPQGKVLRVHHIDREGTLRLLHRALARAFPAAGPD